MAFDGFMWFENPQNGAPKMMGETRDKFYQTKNAFSIKSFSIDAENPHSVGSAGGGSGTSKAKLNPFKVSKWTDNCSVAMFKTCCCGGHYGAATIAVRKAGVKDQNQTGLEYLKFEFHAVFVTNIEWSGESEDELPAENVTFAYGSMQITYTPQAALGGARPQTSALWNQVTNSDDSLTVPDYEQASTGAV